MKKLCFLLLLFIWSNAQSQSLNANLAWLTGVQDRGASSFITKTDHLGNTHVLGIYNGCPSCFMKKDGSFIIEMGTGNDYLFFMKIDKDGTSGQPVLIPSNGSIRVADFDINLNNELVIYLYSDNEFLFNSNEIEEGYSIINLSNDYDPNWIKNIEGASFAGSSIRGSSGIYSSSDQLAVNSKNEILFLGSIPRVNTDVVIDSIVEQSDTFYIYETVSDTLILDGEIFTADNSNFFLTSLDHLGTHNWTKVYEQERILKATGLTLSATDKIGVCGYFAEKDFVMENFTMGSVDTSGVSIAYCMFASTFGENGDLLFADRFYQNAFPKFLTFDNDEELLVAAEFSRTTFLGTDTISSISPASDQLLLKLDQNGNVNWRKRKGNSSTNQFLRVRYTSDDEIISSGELTWPKFLYSFSETGNQIETIGPNVTTNVTGLDIDFTSNGSLISSGTHQGELLLGPYSLPYQPGDSRGQFIAGFTGVTDSFIISTFLGEIDARIDSSLCYENTGSIQISSSIGVDWDDIEWSNGATTSIVANLAPGTHSVSVTDIYGNSGEATFLIPTAVSSEIAYNGIDDDCDPATLDDDFDQDGFPLAEDCDDTNPEVNNGQAEDPYNGIDDDCDPLTLDDDLDQDGFVLADDCDDTNAEVNADQIEEPYNGLDDDCDPLTLDDDLDQDGFVLAEDCDDTNAAINPDAIDIPNNGIDEDCEDGDLMTSIHEIGNSIVNIFPNPVATQLDIKGVEHLDLKIEIYEIAGKLVYSQFNTNAIPVADFNNGIYLLKLISLETNEVIVEKIVVAK